MKVEIKILNKKFYTDDKLLPSYATSGSAALDLICTEYMIIYPGETRAIPTGLAIWALNKLPSAQHNIGCVGLILPRSGLGTKGLILANTIGVIDEDYQGELIVQAWNRLDNSIQLKTGDRFAQLMFIPTIKIQWELVENFNTNTQRGELGFGSTGSSVYKNCVGD